MAGVGWSLLDDWDTWGVFLALSAINLLVLLVRTRFGGALRTRVQRFLRRISWGDRVDWLDWKPLTAIAALWFGGFAAFHLLSGQYGCLPNGLISDPLGELDSGRAFWAGRNPFESVPYCGMTLTVPYGLAAVLLDAVGSLGGLIGILVVWGVVALSVLALTGRGLPSDRAYVTAFVATSILYVPLISAEFSGATNAIVPVTLLVSVSLARRREVLAATVGGFLSTARFPSLFPVLGSTGTWTRRRFVAFSVAAGAFLAATALSYTVWGSGFAQSVFLTQVARRNNSLNFYGILLLHNALPATAAIEGAEAAFVLAVVVAVFFGVRSPVRAVAITIVGVALATPLLSFNFLVWLLPVALVGARARWWLWGVAGVGWINANLGLATWVPSGIVGPTEVMDGLLTVLLAGLFIDLWRERRSGPFGPTGIDAPAEATTTHPVSSGSRESSTEERASLAEEDRDPIPGPAGSYPGALRRGTGDATSTI